MAPGGALIEQRTAWSSAGGVVATVSGTNAVAWTVGATAAGSPLPVWPAVMFGATSLAGAYLLIAALAGLWPLDVLAAPPPEVLDAQIRAGRQARRDALELDEGGARRVLDRWESKSMAALDRAYPVLLDAFQLQRGDDTNLSGQALIVNAIAAKLHLLERARERYTA